MLTRALFPPARTGIKECLWNVLNLSSKPGVLTCLDARHQHEYQHHWQVSIKGVVERNNHTYDCPRWLSELIDKQDRTCGILSGNTLCILDMEDHYLMQNKSAGRPRLWIWAPTFNGVVIDAHNDEAQTNTKGEENRKNNGEAPVPIPHGPCAQREDHW